METKISSNSLPEPTRQMLICKRYNIINTFFLCFIHFYIYTHFFFFYKQLIFFINPFWFTLFPQCLWQSTWWLKWIKFSRHQHGVSLQKYFVLYASPGPIFLTIFRAFLNFKFYNKFDNPHTSFSWQQNARATMTPNFVYIYLKKKHPSSTQRAVGFPIFSQNCKFYTDTLTFIMCNIDTICCNISPQKWYFSYNIFVIRVRKQPLF